MRKIIADKVNKLIFLLLSGKDKKEIIPVLCSFITYRSTMYLNSVFYERQTMPCTRSI